MFTLRKNCFHRILETAVDKSYPLVSLASLQERCFLNKASLFESSRPMIWAWLFPKWLRICLIGKSIYCLNYPNNKSPHLIILCNQGWRNQCCRRYYWLFWSRSVRLPLACSLFEPCHTHWSQLFCTQNSLKIKSRDWIKRLYLSSVSRVIELSLLIQRAARRPLKSPRMIICIWYFAVKPIKSNIVHSTRPDMTSCKDMCDFKFIYMHTVEQFLELFQ